MANPDIDDLIARIRNQEDTVNAPAWQSAETCGAPAVRPLTDLLSDPDVETARRAKRALYRIVRHAGRPGSEGEAKAVEDALVAGLNSRESHVRRELIWMLSELATSSAVAPLAALLADAEVREDARCALTRIPGDKATEALRAALETAPVDFRPALAESLRQRGEKVRGYPSCKLVPNAQTTVTPLLPREN